ncbi:MAG: diacylglycerol kinase family lipid kinase, partial [Pygmaiobacter massiliensis]|nr:diacylglycerol kinase family lipid kinase [Pygmaiobacter massiliensis]
TVIEDDFLYGAFSNSLSVGGIHLGDNLTVKLNDGIFETLLIRAPRNVIEMQNTVGKLLSRDFSSEEVRLIRAQYATFEFEEPVAWTLDGEAGGSCTHCSLGVVPSAITIMRPKDAQ